MRRKFVGGKRDRRIFSKTAKRVAPKNFNFIKPMRGGTRL